MPPVGFEPTISAGEGPKTYALARAATGTGVLGYLLILDTIKGKIMLRRTQLPFIVCG